MESNDPLVAAKQALRESALRARRALDADEVRARSANACVRLLSLPELREARTVLAYVATAEEIDPAAAVLALLEAGVQVVLPRVAGKGLEVAAAGGDLAVGPFGILEPTGPALPATLIDLAVVPGVAFDRTGARLGHGLGYYDRLLPTLREDAFRVGLAFSCQMAARVPSDTHDQGVDAVVTEAALHRMVSPPPTPA